MGEKWSGRRRIHFAIATLVAFAAIVVAGFILSGSLHDAVIRYAEARWQHPIRVDGSFEVRWLSLHPRIVAEQVIVDNPPWTQPGTTARIGRLALIFRLPWFGQSWGLQRIEMERATLHLMRDEQGRANWQATEPGTEPGGGPPLIRSLSVPNARVHLDDARRRLKFEGTISAVESQGAPPRLQFDGRGQLNGRAVEFTATGDPLATARPRQPYRFDFSEESSGSRLTGRGILPDPFDFLTLETHFEAAGADLSDLYFLTGVSLPDTGAYRLSGRFARRGDHLEFTDLEAASGVSDVSGRMSIEAHFDRPSRIEADLRSHRLRLTDIGARAAGRDAKPESSRPLVLPDTPIRLSGSRRIDAVVRYHAHELEAEHVSLRSAAATVSIERGLIKASPVSALVQQGRVTGELQIDATRVVPSARVDVNVAGLGLGQIGRRDGNERGDRGEEQGGSDPPPVLDGALRARIALDGQGRSLHELASNANGTLTAVLSHGAVRSSLAELVDLDLRGLGLMASGSKDDTPVRCGVASFAVKEGTLSAQTLVLDTDSVLITGEGTIALGSESLDLRFKGRPKHPRLRVHAPVLVRGTFRHPRFSIEARNPVAQAGGAVALGVLLTPVAAMLAFVDPGLARDTDCAALIAQAKSGEK